MNHIFMHFEISTGSKAFNPEADNPVEYLAQGYNIAGVAIMEHGHPPYFRTDWEPAVKELIQKYGSHLEAATVIVDNAAFQGRILLTKFLVIPPHLLDIRWLGRLVYGYRPYESLSELYTRCDGMPLLTPELPDSRGVQCVAAMANIYSKCDTTTSPQELSVMKLTAATALHEYWHADVAALNQLKGTIATTQEDQHLRTFIDGILKNATPVGNFAIRLEYGKAVTGRFASGKGCPMQGIPRLPDPGAPKYQAIHSILSAITVPVGFTLVAADAKAIEPRIFAHLVGDAQLSHDLINGTDIYSKLATTVFGNCPAISSALLRQIGKRTFLGFCYGIGTDKLMDGFIEEPALSPLVANGSINKTNCQALLDNLKATYPQLVPLGKNMETAALEAVSKGESQAHQFHLSYRNETLSIKLRSGRAIHYYGIKVDENRRITYFTPNKERKVLYSTKLAQNVVQATARDALVNAIHNVMYKHHVAFHVHDDIVCVVPDGNAEQCKQDLQTAWRTPPSWLPGIQLDADIRSGKNLADIAK